MLEAKTTRARTSILKMLAYAVPTVAVVAALGLFSPKADAESAVKIPPPAQTTSAQAGNGLQTIVLAGGCFWGVQGVFQHMNGVTNAVSGYAGGTKADADYQTVSGGRTGHAEAVEVTFDPKVVPLGTILQVYFSVAHNPTELNRQGPDSGTQYRSEIFPQNDAQRDIAKAYIAQLDAAKAFPAAIATKVDAQNATFFPAEGYHQDYATLHPTQPYIAVYDLPKIENLKTMYPDLYRAKPALVAEAKSAQR
jgi:peptide-methionine (S)-S-oxide reductase